MNHVFCTIWSQALGAWVVASELATRRGKSGGGIDQRPRPAHAMARHPARTPAPGALRLVALAALLALCAPAQAANRYWDANSNVSGMGGVGVWGLTAQTWDDGSVHDGVAGPYLSPWSNAALDTAVFMGTAGTVSLGAPIVAGGLTFNVAGYTIGGSNTLTLGGATPTITATSGITTISAAIAGSAGLIKSGAGELDLTGTNTFTGTVAVDQGTLYVASDAALGAAGNGVTAASGTVLNAGAALGGRVVTLTGTGQTTVYNGFLSSRITGTGGLFSTASPTNTLNDYTGQTTISTAGSISFGSVANLGQASAFGAPTDPTAGTIDLRVGQGSGSNQFSKSISYTGGAAASNRNWRITPGSFAGAQVTFSNNGSGALNLSGDITLTAPGGAASGNAVNFLAGTADMVLSGVISSGSARTVGFAANAGRTLTLGNANTFAGPASISGAGMVRAGTLANAGTASSLGAGSTISVGGNLSYTGGAASIDRAITGAGGTFRNDGTGAFTLAGAATLGTGLRLGGTYTAGDNTLSGTVSGAGFLGSSGPATWVVTGANTGFTGSLDVSGGTLRAGSAAAFGSAIGGITLSGGTLDLNGYSQTTASLSGTGGTLALGAGNLTVDSATSTSFAGGISGTGGLTKLGIGTLTLTGANTYSGATRIGGGTLALDFSSAGAPPSNIISGASTLNMQGGTLRVTGGAGTANAQAFNGLNVLSSSNTLNVAPGTGGSVLVDLGAISYSGGLLNFTSAGTFGSTGTAQITTTRADGTLGGWATINGTDYAKVQGGYIVPFTSSDYVYKDNAAGWLNGEILSDGGDTGTTTTAYYGTVSGSRQIGGLQYVATQNSTVNINGGNTLGVDGTIVVSSGVGAATQRITGGSLTGVTGGGTLGILKNGTGNFTVESTIVDNGGATGFAKSGSGTVVLSGANSYTGATTVSQGTLSVSSIANGGADSNIGASSAASSNLLLQGGSLRYTGSGNTTDRGFTLATNGAVTSNTIEVTDPGANLRFDGQVVSPDGANLIAKGPGTLTLGNTANTYSGTTTIDGGTLAVTELANGGAASSIGTSGSASSSLVMTNGGTLAYLGGSAASDRGFTLNTSGGIGVTNGASTLTMSGIVAGTLAGGTGGAFTKTGAGTLVLSGANTYSGGTTVSAGTLRAGSARAFGTGPIAVNSGATLDIADIPNVRAGGLSGTGTVNLGVLSSTRYIIDGTGSAFGGIIAGAGGVTLGSGSQTFSGCQNTYAGPTTIWGTLAVSCIANGGQPSDIGQSGAAPANLVLAGGTLNYVGTSDASTDRGFTTGGWISVSNPTTTLTFTGQATGSGALVKLGPGTLVLAGTNNDYTGGTTIQQGILRAGATNALGTTASAGQLDLANTAGAVFDLNGFDTTVWALQGGGTAGGEVKLSSKTLTLNINAGGRNYAGLISGAGNLVKNGAGTQYLSGCSNSYTGTTTINAGVLQINCLANGSTNSSIGASGSAASDLVLNGGTLQYLGAGDSTDRQFTLGGSAAIDASGTGALEFTNTAPLTLTGAAPTTLTLTGTNTGNNSLAALIADNGANQTSLSKTGTGTWILRNAGSTYTGVTTITGGGVLGVDKLADGLSASSIGASSNAAGNLVIGTGSTLRYTGAGDSTDRRFTLLSGSTFIESSGTGPINLSNTGAVTLAGATAGASGAGLAHVVNLGGTNTATNIFGATLTDAGTGKTTLSKNGTGLWVLTGNNTFTGDTVINQGNLMVGNGGVSGNVGAGNVYVTNPDSTLSVNRSDTFTLAGTLIGAGTLAQVGAGTTVLTSAASNIGNTTVSAGTLRVDGALTTASVTMNGTSALTVNGTLQASGPAPAALTGDAGASTLQVNTGGLLRASGDLGDGTDTLNLRGTLNTGAGTLNLGTGNDTLVLNDGGTIAGVVHGGTGGESGAGDTLQVNSTAGRTLDGAGTAGFETLLKQGTGTLTLTGTQSYSAGTTVQAGTLLVNGHQAGAGGPTTVQGGAALGGTGTIAGDVTVSAGAALRPGNAGAVGTLTVNGNLTLDSGAALDYQFGQANVPGGALNDLTTVHGNLTLGGQLNVNPASGGSFTPGVYRVFNYDGALTNNGLTIGSAPAGTYAVQTSVANQVNLVNSTGVTLNFWDGPGHQNDGTLQGGNGLWQNAAGGDSWTEQTGRINASFADGAFAIFGGTAGTVTVDNSLGAVRASGMQFTVDGYTIDGGPLTLTGAPSILRVGDGTLAGAGMTATIDAALAGTGGLRKSDLGTLVLGGTNTYTGGTTVDGGTLQVAADANLGDAAGGLTLDGGALRNTAGFGSARTVTLGTNGGTFDTQANLTLSGTVGGTGALTKTGGGTLTLAGSNSYGGGTAIDGGTVAVSGDANLGQASGPLSFNGGTLQNTASFTSARAVTLNAGGGTFQTTGGALTLTGAVGGAGALTKTDAGTLVLAANNTYGGGTTIAGGTLQLGAGGTTGSITGNVANNGTLAFDRSDTYGFGGTISGSGGVTQQGSGITVLTGSNSYAGSTAVNAGTLIVNGNQAAATGATSVAAGATLGGAGTIGGDVSVADGATLSPGNLGSVPGTLSINGSLALGNASTLSYNFGQANVIGGAYNDLTKVAGNLTLGGTLNVTTTPGATFDPGIYRVISYGGTLTDNGLVAGTMPSPSFYLQTSVNHQVNLVNAAGLPVNFWDGPGNQNDGTIQGGTGLWQNAAGNGNWTLGDGSLNASFQDGSFAVFAAAPGTVTVDNSLGAVRNGGMQFAVDGYTIQGDAITLAGAPNILRVGDGTSDGAAMTATIASALTGTGGVQKTDLGTLVLTGANSYGGGTTITAGTLQLGNGGAGGSITGDVVNHGTLAFDRSDSTAFAGAISGSGSVTQKGSGTTVLTGTNTYGGATQVQAGTLLVNGDQSGATGLTTVQGGAALGGKGTIGGDVVIAGGGTLRPGDAGAAGTLTVNGSLSLDSGATLDYRFGQAGTAGGALNDLTVVHGNLTLAGTLNVSATPGGSFGPGVYRVFSYDGALTDNGLALGAVPAGDLFVQTSIARQVNLVNTTGLSLNFWDGPGAQGNGVVDGGSGTWRLADNDHWTEPSGAVNAPYSNGAFAVLAGTPGTVTIDNGKGQVEASGLQFAVDGYRLTGGTLALTGSTPTIRVGDGTAAGAGMKAVVDTVLAGSGTLTKADLGTLVLKNENTYAGGTAISAGTLQLGDGGTSGSIRGDVANNGTLAFNRSDRLDFGGAISGTGAIRQIGAGFTNLTGNSAAFTGTTTVEAGTLAVNGVLGGSTNVLAAGRLQGSGSVGSLAVAGTVAPGNSIGTLNVNGNFTQAAGSTYQVEVDPASTASDLIHATGTASIASGAALEVVRTGSAAYSPGNRYTVLSADGGVTGTYSLQGDTGSAFVRLVDSYDANHVYLSVEKARSFTDAAGTPNQVAVATALESLPDSNGLVNAVAWLPNDFAARDAFNQLSVDIHASSKTAMLEDSRFVREAAIDRLRTAACAPGSAPQQLAQPPQGSERGGCTPADNQARTAWGQVFGSWGHIDSDGNAAKLKRDIGGFVVGADTGVGGGWRVGGLAGYSRASADTDARNSSAKTDSYHLGLYGGTQWGATSLRLGVSQTWNKTDTSRSVAFTGFADSLSAKYDSDTTQLFGEVGHRIDVGAVALEPFAGLAHVRVKTDAFFERGGLAALYGDGGSTDATFSTLGVRASTQLGERTRVRGLLGWRHAFGDTTPTSTHAFGGSLPFTIAGVPLAKNVAVLEAGVETQLKPNLTLGASYAGQFGNGLQDHGFKVNLNWAF